MEQLKHFSHAHFLNLMKVDRISNWEKITCNGCELHISEGLVYGCQECQYFLHKHCIEIPAQLKHPMHPHHKLQLYANRSCICNICRTQWTGFTYVCESCDFDVDIQCSTSCERTNKYVITGHDHNVEFHPRSAIFFCDACGEMGEDASYQCLTCHFWIHQKCGHSPRTLLQHEHHDHPLCLETRVSENYRSNAIFCHICHTKVLVNCWSYLCRDCGHFFHLKCLKAGIFDVIPDEDPSIKENDILKQQIEELLHEKSILNLTVSIQNERQKEFDDRGLKVQQLKQAVARYQKQLRKLEKEESSHDSPGSRRINNLSQGLKQISIDHTDIMDELEGELAKMIGLNDLKEQLRSWVKQVMMDIERQKRGITIQTKLAPPHLALLGNPGTGKTTVARLLGKMLYKFGILPSDKFIEVRRTDLIAGYIGQTGPQTKEKIDEAEGGILFVDEAYELIKLYSKNDFGSEAIGVLMTAMDKEKLSIIVAGYPDEIRLMFASTNPGFIRRMSKFFQFDNYSCEELAEILQLKLNIEGNKFYGFKLESTCTHEEVVKLIKEMTTEDQRNKMNAGLVDQMLNNAKENMDSRLYALKNLKYVDNDLLSTITREDLQVSLKMLGKNRETGGMVANKVDEK
ncbi:DNA helicase [Lithospermum erythrorhizon]|uniref:DNA helicase n=1 Tax=Lithospermum erythrorhizon TaxID=34254 RepID=A0AAV3PJZ8_LITER